MSIIEQNINTNMENNLTFVLHFIFRKTFKNVSPYLRNLNKKKKIVINRFLRLILNHIMS